MAATHLGLGVVWAISSTGVAIGSGSAIALEPTGQTVSREADNVQHRGLDGAVKGVTFFNQNKPLEITVYPSGTTIAAARTINILPTPGQKVVITDSDSDIAGTYAVMSSSKVKGLEEKCVMTFSLMNWTGISSYDPIVVGS